MWGKKIHVPALALSLPPPCRQRRPHPAARS